MPFDTTTRILAMLLAVMFAACGTTADGRAVLDASADVAAPRPDVLLDAAGDTAPADLGPPPRHATLPESVGFDDPLLLTVAAARSRTEYLVDEGYTLARDGDGVVAFATDTAGDLGVAFRVEDTLLVGEGDWASPLVIENTSSDTVRGRFTLVEGVEVALRFVVTSSAVGTLELTLTRTDDTPRDIVVLPWLRRCDGFSGLAERDGDGVRAAHHAPIPPELVFIGSATHVEELAGALAAPGVTGWAGLEACGASAFTDVTALAGAEGDHPTAAAVFGLSIPMETSREGTTVRIDRAVIAAAPAADAETRLADALALAREVAPEDAEADGTARLEKIPPLRGLGRDESLVYRSAYVLLDQLMMPADGKRPFDYYLFSREPTWWFARLGQHIHESLAMVLMADFDPAAATASQRNFLQRVEPDGYLPYNIGPMVEQSVFRTASAPFVAFVSWEIARRTGDAELLAEAYEVGQKLHEFWVTQRDQDGDGLCEWGGFALTESVRDLENVIWEHVAAPQEVEGLDLNCWLVNEERAMARMAEMLGRTDEVAEWEQRADARAEAINETMWDEATGFYYHVARVDNSFTVHAENDLKRLEIAGFMPLWVGAVPAERLDTVLEKLFDPELFWRATGIAGLAATDPYYDPAASQCCRWRGPVWIQWQMLFARTLRELGHADRADELARRALAAVATQLRRVHQFRELYDADDPDATNDSMPNYVWTALIAQMMRER